MVETMCKTTVVLDSGSANLNSIGKALEKTSVNVVVSDNPEVITAADGVVFPGVGAFEHAISRLHEKNLVETLLRCIAGGKPFLGICLGMQLLFSTGEEGAAGDVPVPANGLNVIPGRVKRFPAGLPVPHVGWNMVLPHRPHPLFEGLDSGAYFYFTHSYFVEPLEPADFLAATGYGLPFCSAIARNRLMGVQFHPEKSGPAGLRLLRNFGKIIAEPTIL